MQNVALKNLNDGHGSIEHSAMYRPTSCGATYTYSEGGLINPVIYILDIYANVCLPDVRGDDDVIADPTALRAIYLSDARLRRLARNKRRKGRK